MEKLRVIELPAEAPQLALEKADEGLEQIASELVDYLMKNYDVKPIGGIGTGECSRILAYRLTLTRRKFATLPSNIQTIILFPSDRAAGSSKQRIAFEDQSHKTTPHFCGSRTVFVQSGGLSIGTPSDGIPSKDDIYPDQIDVVVVLLEKTKVKNVNSSSKKA